MPDKIYPYAVKYKGRYYTAGEMIDAGDRIEKVETGVSDTETNEPAKAARRKPTRKKAETKDSEA